MNLSQEDIRKAVRTALEEDLGEQGDITTAATILPGDRASAWIEARQEGVVAGLEAVLEVFEQIEPSISFAFLVRDGDRVGYKQRLAEIVGSAASILTAERTALNFLGHLSGIATATRRLVDAVSGSNAKIFDTRKTTPGLRVLEKYAVAAGGGQNHRMGLFDAILIKDNHLAAAGGVASAISKARERASGKPVQVEVESLDQLREALASGADSVLLDNMDLETMREAVALARGKAVTEASGGVTLANVRAIAETGVDRISVGWITHSAPNLDVALEFDPAT